MNSSAAVAEIKLMESFPLAYWISLLKYEENYFFQICTELCQSTGTRLVPFLNQTHKGLYSVCCTP